MPHCGFCGKLCPTVPGLKRHIDGNAGCKKASRQEFGQYAQGIWSNAPPDNEEGLDGGEVPEENHPIEPTPLDLPDIHLEEDIQNAGALFGDEEVDAPPSNEPRLNPHRATVEDAPDEEEGDNQARYVEEFPEEYRAGATWGQSNPLFESHRQAQQEDGSSPWGPFENEEEWGLAEWLIRNVGQKQTDAFLRLPIVRVSCGLLVHY